MIFRSALIVAWYIARGKPDNVRDSGRYLGIGNFPTIVDPAPIVPLGQHKLLLVVFVLHNDCRMSWPCKDIPWPNIRWRLIGVFKGRSVSRKLDIHILPRQGNRFFRIELKGRGEELKTESPAGLAIQKHPRTYDLNVVFLC